MIGDKSILGSLGGKGGMKFRLVFGWRVAGSSVKM